MTGNACAFNDLSYESRATWILQAAKPEISWLPIVGIGAPHKKEADYVDDRLVLFLANMVGGAPSDFGLLPDISDFMVWDFSQADRNAGAFPGQNLIYRKVLNVTHSDEPGDPKVIDYVLKALDLQYNKPTDTGYFEGRTLFNSGF